MTEPEFTASVEQAVERLTPVVPIQSSPAECRHDYWLWRVAYLAGAATLFFDFTPDTDRCLDIWVKSKAESEAKFNLHTYLRAFDPTAAVSLGRSVAANQEELHGLLQLYTSAILKHHHALFQNPAAIISSINAHFERRAEPPLPTPAVVTPAAGAPVAPPSGEAGR